MKVSELLVALKNANPDNEVWLELMEANHCDKCGIEGEIKHYGLSKQAYMCNQIPDGMVLVINGDID